MTLRPPLVRRPTIASMSQQNQPFAEGSPTTAHLAAAIKKLPRAGPDVPRQTVDIDLGSDRGQYRVTFVVRRNLGRRTPSWFWGVESSERVWQNSGENPS